MGKTTRQKCLVGIGAASLLLSYFSSASALPLNLKNGGDGWINGGFFSTEEMNPGGTGNIEPFVRLQATGSPAAQYGEEGTNTLVKTVLDEKPAWLSVSQLTTAHIFQQDGQNYANFLLDIDEPAADGKNTLNLTNLILYTDSSDQKYPYPTQANPGLMAVAVWNMDVGADGNSEVLLDYNYIGGGSGWWGDLSVLVPVQPADIGKYFYLYSGFTEGNNNPEEWSIASNDVPVPPDTPIPEPGTMVLFGTGLVGFAGWHRKQRS